MARAFPVEEVAEGRARLFVPAVERRRGPGAKGPWPFYNPTNVVSRDMSAMALSKWPGPRRFVLDGLAATGAWGIRMLLEASVGEVVFSDIFLSACDLIRENLVRNGVQGDVRRETFASALQDRAFDFVDIDPFGTPVRRIEEALTASTAPAALGITATDTAVLSGRYAAACLRRYGARPLRCPQAHEIGLRILLGFCARLAGEQGKSIRPLLAFSAEHFLRAVVRVEQVPTEPPIGHVRREAPGLFLRADATDAGALGPMWLGPIEDPEFVRSLTPSEWTGASAAKLLDQLQQEATMPPFFLTTDEHSKEYRVDPPRIGRLVDALRAHGFRAARTHFHPRGVKTDAPGSEILRMFRAATASAPTDG